MNLRLSLAVSLFAMLAPAIGSPRAVAEDAVGVARLDESSNERLGWEFSRGNEFPGAKGGLERVPAERDGGRPGLRVVADLSGGGKYVGIGKTLPTWEIRDTTALRMRIRSSDVRNLTFRISDSSGQTHQKKDVPITADGRWHDYRFALKDLVGGEHWGGSNDGRWHGPARYLFLSITERALPATRRGEIVFGDLRAEVVPQRDLPAADYLTERFESAALPSGWKANGDARITPGAKFDGRSSLLLSRSREKFDAETSVYSPAVPVREGRAEAGGAFKADLDSPDTSFNGACDVEALDGAGKVLETFRLASLSGKFNWTPLRKAFSFPPGTVSARMRVQLNKATGRFWVDGLRLSAPAIRFAAQNPVQRVMIKTGQTGNLFYPGEPAAFDITVQSAAPLAPEHRRITAWADDYWGAEQTRPQTGDLAPSGEKKGLFLYTARVELAGVPFETGRYYELQTRIDAGVGDPVRQSGGFAFLPEAAAKAYSWRDIPFSSRNWDNRLAPYLILSDRLGIRLVGAWGTWSATPPYKPSVPGFDLIRKLGVTMLTRTPIVDVEHHRKGYEAYTAQVLREGVAPFFEKFGKDREIVVTLGNEPQPTGPTVAGNVAMYKSMYQQIKAVSPRTFVVGTSVGPAEEYFKLGFQKYSDAVDFHTYEDSNTLRKTFEKYRELFAKYGGEQPIWATEMGLNAQGLSRRAVAAELIKKFAWFFRFGGQNASWFGICYPDREGRLRGSSEDAFNLFDGLYGNYSPRLDAIAYYNIINGVCIKKFSDYREYPGGLEAFLFLDRNGENLRILWKEHGAEDVKIPLAARGPVKLTRIDGTSAMLEPSGGALDLRIGEDPVLLSYQGGEKQLSAALEAPDASVVSVPGSIVRGESFTVAVKSKEALSLKLPPGWKAAPLVEKDGKRVAAITAPADTEARYVPIRFLHKGGGIDLVVPVQGQVVAEIRPAVLADGRPAAELRLRNNSAAPEPVAWRLELRRQIAPKAGVYSLTAAEPPGAYFGEASEGKTTLAAHGQTVVRVPLEGVDPITCYEVRGTVTDQSGRGLTLTRFLAGFVPVPKAHGPIIADGKLDEPDWQRAPVRKVDRLSQFRHLLPSSNWTGPDDLSGEIRFLWGDRCLHVAVSVRDDVFRNDADGSGIWSGDGLQFLIDPARSRAEKSGKYDYAIGKGKSGLVAWCYLTSDGKAPAGEVKEIAMGAVPGEKGGMTYELSIPWTRLLPFRPEPGADLGIAVILNEQDAARRDGFMTWFGDIQSKEVDPVGDLILAD